MLQRFLPPLVVLLAPIAVYAQVLRFQFVVWDDPAHVTENPHLNPVTWGSLWRFWSSAYTGIYMPLTYTLWAAESYLARRLVGGAPVLDGQAWLFHGTSLVLQVASALVVYGVLRSLIANRWAACAGALLFALHPLQVESVAWVTETKGMLSGLFALLAIYLQLRSHDVPPGAVQEPVVAAGGDKRAQRLRLFATICYVLALLAKPSAVAVPLMMVLLEALMLARPWRAAILAQFDWFLMGAVWLVVTMTAQPASRLSFSVSWWQRPLIAGDSLAFYLFKLVWPMELTADYGRTPPLVSQHWPAYVAWLVPVSLAVALSLTSARRVGLAALGILVAGLAPVLGLFSFHYQEISTVADRYMHLSMLGPALAFGWLMARIRHPAFHVVGAVILAGLALISYRQCDTWRNSETLLAAMLERNPQSYSAHNNLAVLYIKRGESHAAQRHFEEAIRIRPKLSQSYLGLGNISAAGRRFGDAERYYKHAIQLDEHSDSAEAALANLLVMQDRVSEAVPHYRRTLELNPNQPESAHRLARILATSDDPKLRNGPEAVRWAREASRMTGNVNPLVLETLAAAYAEAGQYDDALATIDRGIAIARQIGNATWADRLSTRRALFDRRQPLRLKNPVMDQ